MWISKYIKKLPQPIRLLLGKIFLVFYIPIFIILTITFNLWDSIKEYCKETYQDLEKEFKFCVKYFNTKG